MNEQIESNRALWNELTPIHEQSQYYDVQGFLGGKCTLKSIEKELLGDITGKEILHLQCHFGMDTLSMARLGAKVTGVDISEKAIELAGELASKCKLKEQARFIRSDVYSLPEVLEQEFDIVFTSYGVLCWLNDLNAWAATIDKQMKIDGRFIIVEQHPLADIFEEKDNRVEITYSYFEKSTLELDVDGSYASEEIKIKPRKSYEWLHSMGEIVTALSSRGLRIESLKEYPFAMYRKFPQMQLIDKENGWWTIPDKPNIPLLFSLSATKS